MRGIYYENNRAVEAVKFWTRNSHLLGDQSMNAELNLTVTPPVRLLGIGQGNMD